MNGDEKELPEDTATAIAGGAMLPPHLDAQNQALPADLETGDIEGVMPDDERIDPEEGAP